MKIEIDKKIGSIIAVVAVSAFIFGGALSANRSDGWNMGWMGMHGSQTSKFSLNDIMFAQMMIPHHQQAVDMSELALSKSKNPKILALAAEIEAAQTPEIAQMKQWLNDAKAGMVMDHEMSMSGMLTDEEIAALGKSEGRAFDRLFLEGMIGHHKGAISMVNMIDNSKNEAVRKFGDSVVKTQSTEIALMKKYLATL
jgi:uncharacterized protein (DUF305 family)